MMLTVMLNKEARKNARELFLDPDVIIYNVQELLEEDYEDLREKQNIYLELLDEDANEDDDTMTYVIIGEKYRNNLTIIAINRKSDVICV